jgi:hypothetical protein
MRILLSWGSHTWDLGTNVPGLSDTVKHDEHGVDHTDIPWVLKRTVCWDGCIHLCGYAPDGGAPAPPKRTVTASPGELGSRHNTGARGAHRVQGAVMLSPWERRTRDPATSSCVAQCSRVLPARRAPAHTHGQVPGLRARFCQLPMAEVRGLRLASTATQYPEVALWLHRLTPQGCLSTSPSAPSMPREERCVDQACLMPGRTACRQRRERSLSAANGSAQAQGRSSTQREGSASPGPNGRGFPHRKR